ncbi:MAG: nitroreductase [Pseudomonadales bacterium]|nr:nitroreductase [Pseudomonadales bacterium]
MELLEGLLSRVSQPVLVEPAPDDQSLYRSFQAALRAPDHRGLHPWRYLIVRQDARLRLGAILAASQAGLKPDLSDVEQQRLCHQPLRAPLLVVAINVLQSDTSVPEVEQVLSMGASIQNFMLALHAQGFAAIWRTGVMAEDAGVRAALCLKAGERIAGILYVGTADQGERRAVMLDPTVYMTEWS